MSEANLVLWAPMTVKNQGRSPYLFQKILISLPIHPLSPGTEIMTLNYILTKKF